MVMGTGGPCLHRYARLSLWGGEVDVDFSRASSVGKENPKPQHYSDFIVG